MPDAKSTGGDAGQAEVQRSFDKAEKDGFFGTKVDPTPDSAYSLESGPDSPEVIDHAIAYAEVRVADLKAIKKEKN